MFFGLARQLYTHLAFHSGSQEAFIAIFHRFSKLAGERRGSFDGIVLSDIALHLFVGQRNTDAQDILPLGAVEGKHTVRNKLGDAFVESIVELVDAVGVLFGDFFGIGDFGGDGGAFEKGAAHTAAYIGVFSDHLSGDITRSRVGFQAGLHALFGIQEWVGVFFEQRIDVSPQFGLLQDEVGERGQPFFTGDAGAGLAFGAIG